jgi:hypothetical protein
MWIYFVGPLVALLPERWRRSLPFYQAVPWHAASIISGLVEFLFALGALLYWYSVSVTTWVSKGLDSMLSHSSATGLTDHDIGFAALLIWAMHPLTWVIGYLAIEGTVRICGSFTDSVLGVFPLYLLEKVYSKLSGKSEPSPDSAPKFGQSHAASYMQTVREKIVTSRLAPVPDELCTSADAGDEMLEIRCWRAKADWEPPRVVRFEDRYYRLEGRARVAGPRPYVYKLRRLAAGVPGRTVLIYAPEEAPVVANR